MSQEVRLSCDNLFALTRLGARSAREVKDASGAVLRIEVEPDLQLDSEGVPEGYADMVAEIETTITVPASVSSAQAKIQLRRAGLRDKVDDAVKSAGGEVLDWFTDARTWERNNPYVASLGNAINLKPSDIDGLFISAALISA